MSEKKQCVHCHRSIDVVARVCPYCNRDQDAPRTEVRSAVPLPPIETPPPPRVTSAAQAKRREWSTRALLIAAVVALLTASFAVGGLVYGLGKRGAIGTREEERPPQAVENIGRSEREFPQLTLVEETDPTTTISQVITTVPIPDPDHKMPQEFQRTDATALPSTEYSKLLEQQKKQQAAAPPQVALADPRAVTAQQPPAVYAQPRPAPRPEEPPTLAEQIRPERAEEREERDEFQRERFETRSQRRRTQPVPLYQPLPRMDVQDSGTVRFRLSVGRDGRVNEIRVLETMPGMTGKMIAAIQKWKFRPATENGIPVEGTFMVDISFNAPD